MDEIKSLATFADSLGPAPQPSGSEPVGAKAKLRAFEDEVFGKKVNRINGDVERGIGSPYALMTPRQKAHYAALEQLIAAEKGIADATAALASAQTAHETAMKATDAAAQAMDETE